MVDTNKEEVKDVKVESNKVVFRVLIERLVIAMLVMLLGSVIFKVSLNKYIIITYGSIIAVAVICLPLLKRLNRNGDFKAGKFWATMISVVIPFIGLASIVLCDVMYTINYIESIDSNIETHQQIDLLNYDSRFDVILPNDVIKQNGLTLYDTLTMSEQLRKSYSDDGFDLVIYEDYQQNGEVLEVTVRSNLNQRYTISINTSTKIVDSNIIKSEIDDNVKTLTEMGEPIYSFTPDEKTNFEEYVTNAGYTNDTSLCSVEERKCCWYIYFTDSGNDCYVRVDKKTNEVTEKGNVLKGERIKEGS